MSRHTHLKLHFDGGSRGNPGPAAVGITLVDAESNKPVHEAGYFLGRMTNNAAEYEALLRGVDVAKHLAPASLTICSDSELLVRQINGEYRVKSKTLRPLFEKARHELTAMDDWSIQHVRREFNQRADELANDAMDAGDDVMVLDASG